MSQLSQRSKQPFLLVVLDHLWRFAVSSVGVLVGLALIVVAVLNVVYVDVCNRGYESCAPGDATIVLTYAAAFLSVVSFYIAFRVARR